MKYRRSAGILLHPTSLPGPFGIGDIGPQALRWIDFLAGAGCGLWQMLPLGPTGYGDSPYQCFSAFAGNPYLISPEALMEDGLLDRDDLLDRPNFPDAKVDYGQVIDWKIHLLKKADRNYQKLNKHKFKTPFAAFREEQKAWLPDFALFMALKDKHSGQSWVRWDKGFRDRETDALSAAQKDLAETIEQHAFWQFLFFRQWDLVRDYAHNRGITLIGDAPIFVAHDSADVWAKSNLFYLTPTGRPKFQAGVPPDYFSPTGQLWGNPLYRWRAHKSDGYAWWINRISTILSQVDLVRLDHFRGFVACWQVPGRAKTAEKGRWVKGPGMDFLRALQKAFGELPIIAEDLGLITADVVRMRDTFGLPGMKILQFAFGHDPENPFLPHHYPVNCVVYTGTHDNDTVLGWYKRVTDQEKSFYRRYLDRDGGHVSWDMIRATWGSVAVFALAPMQDFLELDNQARMNYPGKPDNNWTWRLHEDQLSDHLQERIFEINYLYSRQNKSQT